MESYNLVDTVLSTSISPETPKRKTADNKKLEKILRARTARIRVVGTGGSGNNTLVRMAQVGIEGAELIAMNTDAQHLLVTDADKKLLLGEGTTRGLGAGAEPDVGEMAAQESAEDISAILDGSDLVFIACGLGGGTGTGSAPIIAKVCEELGILSVGIVTLPFSVEGKKRAHNAIDGLKKLMKHADSVILVPNDKLLEIVPELPLNMAFKVADEILTKAVKGITELITKPGLVNLDFADVRTILRKSGTAMIGVGESLPGNTSEKRALESLEAALNSPLLDIDISQARRALIQVTGGPDMTLKEAEMIVEAVGSKIHEDSNIIWGTTVNEKNKRNILQTMVIIAGGKNHYLEHLMPENSELSVDYI